MAHKSWRDDFMHACGKAGIPVYVAVRLIRHANTVQRAAEIECSVSDEETRAYWKRRGDNAEIAVVDLLIGEDVKGWRVEFRGDPRGACTLLHDRDGTRTLAVPSTGFTAAQIDRLSRIGEGARV